MLLTLSGVLDAAELDAVRQRLDTLRWRDGGQTAGPVARQVKRNQQVDLSSRTGRALHDRLLGVVRNHAVFQAAVRPKRFSKLLISRAEAGGHYGAHVDNALMRLSAERLRTDISFTLFLSDPDSYEGGELIIQELGYTQSFKPAAGDLVLYPSTRIHEVAPVTLGTRLACVGWVESLVRDVSQREILFDLANLKAELARTHDPQSAEMLTLSKTLSNLLRMWCSP